MNTKEKALQVAKEAYTLVPLYGIGGSRKIRYYKYAI